MSNNVRELAKSITNTLRDSGEMVSNNLEKALIAASRNDANTTLQVRMEELLHSWETIQNVSVRSLKDMLLSIGVTVGTDCFNNSSLSCRIVKQRSSLLASSRRVTSIEQIPTIISNTMNESIVVQTDNDLIISTNTTPIATNSNSLTSTLFNDVVPVLFSVKRFGDIVVRYREGQISLLNAIVRSALVVGKTVGKWYAPTLGNCLGYIDTAVEIWDSRDQIMNLLRRIGL
ncbi:predicted protein [Naegleria gruberi]|uniref:Predicted protein n=1 Tax=Naegleria gruberi TaxID=5762 RepID=D2VRT3_NAEGR|nr:uncharacterized protein NAEGRDRAFT_71695 [Naegleria gruberi]EFC40518.1 predicted protein [Naegleria gruberi]|eukprot:XP_002673262.1 predicted protein [Naegleria gruberi strain NEG-M]